MGTGGKPGIGDLLGRKQSTVAKLWSAVTPGTTRGLEVAMRTRTRNQREVAQLSLMPEIPLFTQITLSTLATK